MSPSHPNRSAGRKPGRNPAPKEIAQAREEAELTQTQAAAIVYRSLRTWQDWESGARRMPPDTWILWRLKWRYPQIEELLSDDSQKSVAVARSIARIAHP